jgi:hypothetical protein
VKGFDSPLWYRLNPDGSVTGVDDPRGAMQPIDERRIDETYLSAKGKPRRSWRIGRLTLRLVGWRREREEIRVSTVFLSLDHAHFDGPPILFETMIFGGEHDMWQDRYATIEQARRGHQRVVENLRAGRDPGSESPDEVNW